ncbi:MAG: hypothetical protein ACRENP_28880 [Longimicrobiales bacterium]
MVGKRPTQWCAGYSDAGLALNGRYDMGEITIVVVGILIGLAVYNWNDARDAARRKRITWCV